MKIGSVIAVFPPYRGGMGVVAQREMRALEKRGAEVTVFTAENQTGRFEDQQAVGLKPWFRIGNAAVLPQLIWRLRKVDMVHLHYPFYGGALPTVIASYLWRKPLLVTYHMRAESTDWRNTIFSLHRRLLEPLLMRAAHCIFVSSKDYAHSVNLAYTNLCEQPFGVDTNAFRPSDQHTSNELTLLFVGGMDRAHDFKGVPELLKAAATLPEQGWNLTLIGDGDQRSFYESLAQTLQMSDRVNFVGSVSDTDLKTYFQQADVHILPSTNQSEAFGLVTLEAAASGCASIVSNLPGVRTLVQDGQTGYIVEPGDVGDLGSALTKCLRDPDRVRSMGQRARERVVREYDQEHLMDQLFNAFTALV